MGGAPTRHFLAATLQAVADGDQVAFERLYKATAAKIFGVCLTILADRAEAEEVLQEVFLTVWQKAVQYDETIASPITWIMTIARNRSIDRLRARSDDRAVPIGEAHAVVDPAISAIAVLEMAEQRARLIECLALLERRDAAAIQAAYLGGMRYGDLARRDGTPLGTMKSRIRRAMARLRECLSL